MSYRKLTFQEEKILKLLLSKISKFEKSEKWQIDLLVERMMEEWEVYSYFLTE